MGEFRVYAKLGGLVEGDTPEDAKRHAQRILTTLLEPRGFEVIGVAAVEGDRIPGKLATAEESEVAPDAGAVSLLKRMQREFFAEDVRLSAPRVRKMGDISLHEYPLEIKVGDLEAHGRLIEVNPGLMTPGIKWSDAEKKLHGFSDEPPAHMDIPEGHYGYGWQAKLELDPLDIGKAARWAGRLNEEMARTVKLKLDGIVKHKEINVDTESESPVAATSGLFTTPIAPEEMAKVLSEKIGIRSMLPKEVAETERKSNDFSGLLKSLFQ